MNNKRYVIAEKILHTSVIFFVAFCLYGCGQNANEAAGACVTESLTQSSLSREDRIEFVHACMNSKGFNFTFEIGCPEQRANGLASDACYQKSGWLEATFRKLKNWLI